MKRELGVVALLMGSAILAWAGYNLLIERQPEATGSPLPALGVSAATIYVGIISPGRLFRLDLPQGFGRQLAHLKVLVAQGCRQGLTGRFGSRPDLAQGDGRVAANARLGIPQRLDQGVQGRFRPRADSPQSRGRLGADVAVGVLN